MVGNDPERLAEAVDAARYASGGAAVTGDTVDLLDLDSTRDWALRTEKEFGRVDGLVHLVGGWRGSETFTKTSLDDWDFLELLLIRTVQHTSLAFFEPPAQRARPVSADQRRRRLEAHRGQRRCTPPPRPPPRRGRSRWPTPSARPGRRGLTSAAAILVVKALVHDAMRADRPNAKFAGFTDVKDLAEAVVGVWDKSAAEVNGTVCG